MSLARIDQSLLQENTLRAFEEQRFEDALRLIEPALRRFPDAELYNNLGALCFQLGWLREAEAAFRRALELAPEHPAAFTNLVDYYQGCSLDWAALRVLEEAAKNGLPELLWKKRLEALRGALITRRVSVCLTPSLAMERQASLADPEVLEQSLAQLRACLRSLADQTFPLYELLVEEGSPLHTAMVNAVGETILPGLIRAIPHQALPGRRDFPNAAFRQCSGELFVHVQVDQRFERTWLERAVLHLENPEVGLTATRVFAAQAGTILEQFFQATIPRESGARQLEAPPYPGEPGCLFRVSAVKRIGGWGARWGGLLEEVERARRIREAGFQTRYENSALLYRSVSSSLEEVLQEVWQLRCSSRTDAGVYDRLELTSAALSQNASLALKALSQLLGQGREQLLYPAFFQYYAFAAQDLRQLAVRSGAQPEVIRNLALAFLMVGRHALRRSFFLPPRVIERAVQDLEQHLLPMLEEPEREAFRALLSVFEEQPERDIDPEEVVEAVCKRLPAQAAELVRVFAGQRYLESLGSGMGSLLERSVGALDAEGRRTELLAEGARHVVLYNPPARVQRKGEGGALARWLSPSRLDRLTRQLEDAGAVVTILDAVAQGLDERAAEQVLLSLEPDQVIYSAHEGAMERLVLSARRLKLVVNPEWKLSLIFAESLAEQWARRGLAMFDEVVAELPGGGATAYTVRVEGPAVRYRLVGA